MEDEDFLYIRIDLKWNTRFPKLWDKEENDTPFKILFQNVIFGDHNNNFEGFF